MDTESIARPAENLITNDMNLGQCWAMSGTQGWVLLKLSQPIVISEVSVEHISKGLTPVSQSTPKSTHFYGVSYYNPEVAANSEDEAAVTWSQGDYLASLTYDVDGPRIQEGLCENSQGKSYGYVNMTIDSNYGASYTCIYRVRVHGAPLY